ncbi:T9SS type A sorting domain-containing protein [Polaribacter sp.]|uniref:T9SS type A sorting domain-containing protein n=1 Tax=Polaribacter sp. TaxID=1920175 RepID=UPI0025DE6B21|nr:T9SS type A sorting domain-containing protein [Polaribacter sp.]
MRKLLFTLSIILFTQYTFSQFENYRITNIGLISNIDINGVENAITVPEGKVWKIISGLNLKITDQDGDEVETYRTDMVGHNYDNLNNLNNLIIPEGFNLYSITNSSLAELVNWIEYDLSQQALSYTVPKIDKKPTLFPNPTSSLLSLNSDKEYDIEVYDMVGNKVMSLKGNKIDMSNLSSAIYIVKAFDKLENKEVSYKVVKN